MAQWKVAVVVVGVIAICCVFFALALRLQSSSKHTNYASAGGGCVDEENSDRQSRLDSNVRYLFHQTDPDTAAKIISSQKFLRGGDGCLAGSGIYFAVSPSDTNHKARNRGVILKARVRLGNVRMISANGESDITFTSLINQGYDSVLIPRQGGDEFVVYNYDQVSNIGVS